jgi:hypothetical protein
MKRNAFVFAGLLAIAITAAIPPAALASPEKAVSAAPLEVTYYYLPT